jgi:putative nucleotidyltransferase with HDIG domain
METINLFEEIKKRVQKIPTLPIVATRLMQIIDNPQHSSRDVVDLIVNDVSLTSRILRVANSAAFARGKEIDTLNRAILHLGENLVVGIAIGSCTSSLLNKQLPGYESEPGDLWEHSLRSAIASRLLTKFTRFEGHIEQAFTGGLLHDIGKLVLSEFMIGMTGKVVDYTSLENEVDYLDAEKKIIGATHSDVGFTIASHWNLPSPLPEIIKHHHRPSEYEGIHKGLIYVVHLADIFSMMGGSGTGADALTYKLDEGYTNYIDFQKQDLTKLLLQVQEEFQSTKQSIFNPAETQR